MRTATPLVTCSSMTEDSPSATSPVISTPRFEVYTTLRRQRTLQYIPVFYERCFKHYVTALGPLPSPDRKLVSFIFSDGRQSARFDTLSTNPSLYAQAAPLQALPVFHGAVIVTNKASRKNDSSALIRSTCK